jgi:UDP-N-acetyl-D-glucosamine dehydrogenase
MAIIEKLRDKSAHIGIIGLGYIGLPLALEFALKGFRVTGFDNDRAKIPVLEAGQSYIRHIPAEKVGRAVKTGRFIPTDNFAILAETDAVIICVPTPLNRHREPELKYIVETARTIAKYLKKGRLISLESTTYPGTTEEVVLPILAKAPLERGEEKEYRVGEDFYLAFSPEREDPNNPHFNTATIPKVIGGVTEKCREAAAALYENVVVKTVPVSSAKAAEAAKLLENIYRSVNIALVNELKIVFDRMGIDIWEVIEAAKTKPFGFHPFYPGPGLGGHCIPIDPFYLTWKAREFDINTKFIELAGEINTGMPYYVVGRTAEVLSKAGKPLNGAKALILGAAYKKDIDDMRESPSLKLIEILRQKGAEVEYNDPYVPVLPKTRRYNLEMSSVDISGDKISGYDVVILSADHSVYDYKFILERAKLIIDTRNAFAGLEDSEGKVFKA